MEASQHSLLAAYFTLHSINATLAIVPQRGAGLWIGLKVKADAMRHPDVPLPPKYSVLARVYCIDEQGIRVLSSCVFILCTLCKKHVKIQFLLNIRTHLLYQYEHDNAVDVRVCNLRTVSG
jgi:hypothetical protein